MNAGARSMLPVLSCFLLSGASGLVYEIVWTRMLALVSGGTTLAISTILTAFLGGLALGAWLGGRLADRLSRPLRVYGLIELAVGLYALATPWVFASAAFAQLWRGLADPATAGLLASFLARFAMAALERAVALAPGDLPSHIGLARAHLMAGEPDAARDALASILALRPGSSQLQYWRGRIALALDDPASARAALEIAPRLGPVPLDAHAHLGTACERLGDSGAALAAYESFVRGASGTALAAEVAARIEALRRAMAPR